jgi:DNA-binding CsgD family transcriptional regulator
MSSWSLEGFIEETNRAESSLDVSALFGAALKSLGYDRFCYSLITAHPSLGLEAGHGVAKNYPDDWMAYYQAKQYHRIDPVPQQALADSRPFTWDSLPQMRELSPEQKKVMNEAREVKLLSGVGVPLYGANGELAGVGIASSVEEKRPDKNLLGKIRAIASQFHLAYTDLLKGERPERASAPIVHLTAREREILLWAAEGKGDAVIAEIIGVSHSTIRFHMNNIFKKLDANERTLATVKAIRLGLILPSCYGS